MSDLEITEEQLEDIAQHLGKLDTEEGTRAEWNSCVMEFISKMFSTVYDSNSEQQQGTVAEIRQRSYPYLKDGDNTHVAPLPVWTDFIPEEPRPMKQVLEILDEHVNKYNGYLATSGSCMQYVPQSGQYASCLGGFLGLVLNVFSAVTKGSPGAARVEQKLVRWCLDVVGFPSSSAGYIESGCSSSTLLAIVTARESIKLKPVDFERCVVYVTELTHHCIHKCLRVVGLGNCIIRNVDTDMLGRMDVRDLERRIVEDKQVLLLPFMVVGTAGTAFIGSIDPLTNIGQISKAHSLWFHVDAAYGGFFILTEKGKEAMAGINTADSIAMDPHKSLFQPFASGVLLVRDGSKMKEAMTETSTFYDDVTAGEDFENESPASYTYVMSRPFRALPIWFSINLLGMGNIQMALNEKLYLAQYFYKELLYTGKFVLGPCPQLSTVLFRCESTQTEDPDADTKALHKHIISTGNVLLGTVFFKGNLHIYVTIMAYRTHKKHVDMVLSQIKDRLINGQNGEL